MKRLESGTSSEPYDSSGWHNGRKYQNRPKMIKIFKQMSLPQQNPVCPSPPPPPTRPCPQSTCHIFAEEGNILEILQLCNNYTHPEKRGHWDQLKDVDGSQTVFRNSRTAKNKNRVLLTSGDVVTAHRPTRTRVIRSPVRLDH